MGIAGIFPAIFMDRLLLSRDSPLTVQYADVWDSEVK
jgi:hypothetical protein